MGSPELERELLRLRLVIGKRGRLSETALAEVTKQPDPAEAYARAIAVSRREHRGKATPRGGSVAEDPKPGRGPSSGVDGPVAQPVPRQPPTSGRPGTPPIRDGLPSDPPRGTGPFEGRGVMRPSRRRAAAVPLALGLGAVLASVLSAAVPLAAGAVAATASIVAAWWQYRRR